MTTSLIPTYKDLSFYSNPESNEIRYNQLAEEFNKNFNAKPDFFARSPGRVNLMGDHIDYNFFSVLPMAIDVDVVAAVKRDDSRTVIITNTDSVNFAKETFELPQDGSEITIDQEAFSWGNYFKCGFIVAHKYILENRPDLVSDGSKPLKGLKITFNGTVPTGGGLSSSAAFCVASTLAVLRANGIDNVSKADLTRITVVSEHYVGVNTGGMDQCASVYGEVSKALLIHFKPKLLGIPFGFPKISKDDELTFLISNSLQKANKHETAPIHYNLRVVEMAIASDILSKKLNINPPRDSNLSTSSLRGVMDAYFTEIKKQDKWDADDFQTGIDRLRALLELIEDKAIFTDEQKIGFTVEDAAKTLGLDETEFQTAYLTKFPVRFELLKLYQRTKHVFAESLRVLECLSLFHQFKQSSENPQQFLEAFGKIMNESQVSLDTLNNSSNEKLNEICSIALKNGSYGSRVTGAGWGGSIVHLTTTKNLQKLVNALTTEYYKVEFPEISQEELNEAIVDSKPAAGSCVVLL
ncbi:galactokinase [Scheffersomyces xylosifermentans]|uniref:galactokinase n=1 Tax=Scheffersomyces xylosifermentans TaxID=1304137 RepID=UPI00315D59DA